MDYSPLIAPVVALVAWSIVILFWMAFSRFSEFRKAGISLKNAPPGGRGVDLDGKVDARAQWKSHNYNHLMEQPTIFYAIVLASIFLGMDQPINVALAWGYVGFRILHSIVQATVNKLSIRFPLFLLASLCLVGLTVHAAARILHDCFG